ncbi:hypothetical protein JCM8208_001995 [Rhodotorula glutinis]
MARTSSTTKPKPKPTKATEEKEWVIETILKHKRKDADLKYLIAWEACDETTWESESDVGEGEAVDEYWAQAKAPLERYTLNSAAYRALAKQLKRAGEPKVKKPKKRASRSSSGDQDGEAQAQGQGQGQGQGEEDDDEDEQQVQVYAARKKRVRRSDGNGQDDVKPGVDDEPAFGVAADGNEDDVGGNARVECGDWLDVYGSLESWETEVKHIDTLEQNKPHEGVSDVRIVWRDDSFSVVPLAVARARCVQKLLDFMLVHLTFNPAKVDEAGQEGGL